ncbi:SMI1/KNR4 family protein [Exiguobacterium sp.]|uniref:SMI1/KNR4 family protein n=1 Tax=Exiguobacterium sp. TaxID=44751 RepID=UPI00307F52B0
MSYLAEIKSSDAETFSGVNEEEVREAEKQVGMAFPETYREIVKEFGSLEIGSDEIFGLGVDGYLNVVETTLKEREIAEGKLDGYLVLQNLGTEGILIVVDEQDRVFEYQLGEFRNLLSSTAEYIKSLL